MTERSRWSSNGVIGHHEHMTTKSVSLGLGAIVALIVLVLVVMPYMGYDVVRFFRNIGGVP
jgi:hypothetical protein